MLLPTLGTALRRSLDHWFQRSELRPRVVGEHDPGALMKIAAAAGPGVLPIPTAAKPERPQGGAVRRTTRPALGSVRAASGPLPTARTPPWACDFGGA